MKVVHKDLQALGIDHESVKKFLKYKEADAKVGDDPYASSTADKATKTKAYRALHKDLSSKTKNANVAINAMTNIHDYKGKDAMYESMMSFKSFLEEAKDPCWKGYKQLGVKDKNGKKVPNCIPVSEDEEADYVDTSEYKTDKRGRKYHPRKIKLESEDDDMQSEEYLNEAEYQGREVSLDKPFRTPDGPKKFAVYVKNSAGKVVIVRFGDPNMEIKRDDPERRKSFRARHNCDTANDKTTPRYWSCHQWRAGAKVES